MSLFKKLFGNNKNPANFMVATLNDKIMPLDRGVVYEDPLNVLIQAKGIGEVTGGGTMQHENGEIDFCDVEIRLNTDKISQEEIQIVIDKLEELGAPKGSKLRVEKTDQMIEFGKLEGLGIYLDGINLSDEVYTNSNSEALANEIIRLAKIKSKVIRYWQGNTETGLYFYGESFDNIKNSISEFVESSPDCENARIERVA